MSQPARILVVDDEPNVRLVLRTTLESSGYLTIEAEDGAAALRSLDQTHCDLALLDLNMPGMGGMQVLERLRQSNHDVPVVIVTAHASVPNAVQAMKLGAIDFLAKPITPDTLRSVVAEVLRRHEAAPTAAGSRGGLQPETKEPVTAGSQFAYNMNRAKRALNYCWFEEAEVFLKQAIALNPKAAEPHNLLGVLFELRNEHDASYREYRAALKADRHYEPAKHNMLRYYERFAFGRSNVPIDFGDAAEDTHE
jgi:DNA-binding response OmpR family regulator